MVVIAIRAVRYCETARPPVADSERKPLHILSRRDPQGYGRTYSRWLNPLYEPGMSTTDIATQWLQVEGRLRGNIRTACSLHSM